MNNRDYYKKYEPMFGDWHIKHLIGEGSYGQVFEIEKNELGTTYKAALKTITIPQSRSEIDSIKADGLSDAEVTEYYKNVVTDIVKESELMSKLKGNSNIVSYEDHLMIKHQDEIGWDILIKMELLTPLLDYIANRSLTIKDVVKLGIDLSRALVLCEKNSIIHRDIKPGNIFVSDNGDFKLGDFGVARTLEKTTGGLSKKGTFVYMAPEIYRGEAYGSNVDIYSLGIVMYWLLNKKRTPFLPAYPNPISYNEREMALIRRIRGENIDPPIFGDDELIRIVLKACAFNPSDRYHSAREMLSDLEKAYDNQQDVVVFDIEQHKKNKSIKQNDGDTPTQLMEAEDETALLNDETSLMEEKNEEPSAPRVEPASVEEKVETSPKEPKDYKKLAIICAVICALLLVGIAAVKALNSNDKEKPVETEQNTAEENTDDELGQADDSFNKAPEFAMMYSPDDGCYWGGEQFGLPAGGIIKFRADIQDNNSIRFRASELQNATAIKSISLCDENGKIIEEYPFAKESNAYYEDDGSSTPVFFYTSPVVSIKTGETYYVYIELNDTLDSSASVDVWAYGL